MKIRFGYQGDALVRIARSARMGIAAHAASGLHALLSAFPPWLLSPETSKRMVRLFYSTVLKAGPRPNRYRLHRTQILAAPLVLETPEAGTKWDPDTITWAKGILEAGSFRPPFPENDAAESASDTFRMRGVLAALAEHWRATGSDESLERLGQLIAETARMGDGNKAWAWDTTNAALRLLSMLRANETLRAGGKELPGWADWGKNYAVAHEPALALGRRVEPAGNHEALNFAGRLALHYLLRPEDPMPSSARAEMTGIIEAQFLGDGGHVERAPHYHLQITALLDFLLRIEARRGGPGAAGASRILERARDALRLLISPEQVPIPFGDVGRTWSGMHTAHEVLALRLGSSGPVPNSSLEKEFGIAHREWDACGHALEMWVDVGPVGFERNPGHGHADALSFTLYVDGHPLVVDPGTLDYSARRESLWHRLPEAHNSVYWPDSPAYRLRGVYRWTRHPARPQLLPLSAGHTASVAARQDWTIGKLKFAHRRELIPNPRGLSIIDDIYAEQDDRAIVRLGLSPGVSLTLGPQVIVQHESGDVQIQVTGDSVRPLRLVDSSYSPRYGVGVDAKAVEADCAVAGWTRIVTQVSVLDGNASRAR